MLSTSLPSWLDLDFVRTASAVLALVSIVLLFVLELFVRSVAARVVAVIVLGAAVVGLVHYRQELDHCDKNGCACTFLGQELQGGGCNTPH